MGPGVGLVALSWSGRAQGPSCQTGAGGGLPSWDRKQAQLPRQGALWEHPGCSQAGRRLASRAQGSGLGREVAPPTGLRPDSPLSHSSLRSTLQREKQPVPCGSWACLWARGGAILPDCLPKTAHEGGTVLPEEGGSVAEEQGSGPFPSAVASSVPPAQPPPLLPGDGGRSPQRGRPPSTLTASFVFLRWGVFHDL